MANYPASAPSLGTAYADATASVTNHAAAHNAADAEVNAIGSDLVTARGTSSTMADRIQGFDYKRSCRVGSTANITISPGGASLVIDGVTLVNADRVFLKDQTTPAQNGIYVVGGVGTSVTLTRATDAATAGYLNDTTLVTVEQGTVNGDTAWEIVTDNPITIGTTPLYWARIWPPYETNGPKNPWAPTGTLCQNFPRDRWNTTITLPTAATWLVAGGGVLPAGRTITNVNVYWGTAGTHTVRHFSIVRASDFVVLQRTANTTAATGTAMNTIALQATYLSPVDVPIYLFLGIASSAAGAIGCTTAMQNTNIPNVAPVLSFNSTATPPTATPPTVGATLPVSGTVQSNIACYYLS